jgi:pimeloyl-ACP methyl ester carboxylesterase
MVRAHWCQAKSFQGLAAYLVSLPASATEAAAIEEPLVMPVTVLSASNATPEQLAERDHLTSRSPRGRHIIARKSGHWIHLDEPDLVVGAIREMVELSKPS